MNFITKLKILFFLIFSLTSNVKAQNLEDVIAFADLQYESRNYNSALREYERALFFSNDKKHTYLFRQTANCFFSLDDYESAMTYYDYAYINNTNDSIKLECLFQKTLCYILLKNFNLALVELYSMDESVSDYFQRKKHFYLGTCNFGLERYDEAFNSFLSSASEDNETKDRLISHFKNKKRLFRPNPKTALILSIIVPGSGQIYSGDIKNGINSFLLCGGLFAIGVNIAI
ncbi:hypothetical protein ACFLTI_10340, partial [Bacteroidota bacterium]